MKVEGIDNLLRNLDNLDPDGWKKKVLKEMRGDHKEVRSSMRSKVPVDDGRLKRSIRTNSWMKTRQDGELSLFVRTGPRFRKPGRMWYAHFVELGTPKQDAAHFVKETKEQYENGLVQGIKNAIGNVLDKANGK